MVRLRPVLRPVVDVIVREACDCPVIVMVNVLLPDAYKAEFVGVKVAVIVELPGATYETVAPPDTGATVVELVFELV